MRTLHVECEECERDTVVADIRIRYTGRYQFEYAIEDIRPCEHMDEATIQTKADDKAFDHIEWLREGGDA